MKKPFKYLLFLTILPMLLLASSNSFALFITDMLKSPSFGIVSPDWFVSGVTTVKTFGTTTSLAMSTKNTVENTVNDAKNLGGAITSGNFSALMDGSISPGQMGINECAGMKKAECKLIDFTDADSLEGAKQSYQKTLKVLFLTYPKNAQTLQKQDYEVKANEFYEDTVVEVYTATNALEKYLQNDVAAILQEANDAIMEGGAGSPAPDTKVDAAYAQAKAYESIDNLLQVLQQAVALKAQLRSARMITQGLNPISYEEREEEDKNNQSSLFERGNLQLASSATIGEVIPLAFAQIMEGNRRAVQSIAAVEDAQINNSSSSQKIVGNVEGFGMAPESEVFHPYVYEEDKLNELEKITPIAKGVNVAQNAHNMIVDLKSYQDSAKSYKEMVEQHKKSVDALKASEQCALKYIGRRFSNPEIVWSGRPLGGAVTNHELRSGISGWALDAFEAAKAAKVSPLSTDDLIAPTVDESQLYAYADVSNMDATVKELSQNETFTANPSQQEQQDKDNREIGLISWQMGSEASKLLVENPHKWGTLNKRFPIWTDTKSFYNQYLDGKYINIKAYLKMISASDVKALMVAANNGEDKNANETLKQKEFAALDLEATQENQDLLQEQDKALSSNKKELKGELALLEQEKTAINEELDAAALKVKNLSEQIQDLRQKIKDDTVNSMQKAASTTDNYKRYNDEMGFIDSDEEKMPDEEVEKTIERLQEETKESQGASLQSHSIFSSHLIIASAFVQEDNFEGEYKNKVANSPINDEIMLLENQIVTAKKEVDKLQIELNQINEKIKQQKLISQSKVSGINENVSNQKISIFERLRQKRAEKEGSFSAAADKGVDAMAGKVFDNLLGAHNAKYPAGTEAPAYSGPTKGFLISNLDAAINMALSDLYEKMDKKVDATRKQLADMGDKLYDPTEHDKVVAIHKRLMDELKALPLQINKTGLNAAMTIYMYKQLLPADVSAEEEDFFVGLPAKERDLKAPKKVMDYNLPPMREIVHFDDVDEQNVKPFVDGVTKSGAISKDDFLDYGGEIPAIWKLMLREHAFVEQDFNLNKALNVGCTNVAFFRGGFMPCQIKNSGVALDVSALGQYVRAKGSLSGLSACPYLEYKDGKVYNTLNEATIPMGPPKDAEDANCEYSELGVLLDADENGTLSIREKTFDAFYALIKEREDLSKSSGEDELNEAERAKKAIYSAAPLSVNQIGDFLKYVENEQKYRQVVEELTIKHEEMKKNLYDMLKSFGFEPSASFDITNESDFNLARQKLDGFKNREISEALTKISEVNIDDNEVAEERVDKYKKVIAALQKDKDELTNISDVVIDNNSLDEDIKSSKVNNDVSQKYDDKADEVANNVSKLSDQPFCAVY